MSESIVHDKKETLLLKRCYHVNPQAGLSISYMGTGAIVGFFGVLIFIVSLALEIEGFLLQLSIFLFLLGFGLLLWGLWLNSHSVCEVYLLVTNKRVCKNGPHDEFVYMPLNQISAVSICGKTLCIASAGGKIEVPVSTDGKDVCDLLMKLINQLQGEVEIGQEESTNVPSQPMRGQRQKAPSVSADSWTCTCGRVNPSYQTTCSCGVKKPAPKANSNRSATVKVEATGEWRCTCGRVNPSYQTTCSCGVKKPVPQPAKPVVDATPYLGKKFCSGCGELIADSNVKECPACGSKYLTVITDANAQNIIPNIEKH